MSSTAERTIITTTPAIANDGVLRGKPLSGVVEVLYSDGTEAFRCVDCIYESPSSQRVVSHRRKHTRLMPKASRSSDGTVTTKQVREAVEILQKAADAMGEDTSALKRKVTSLEARLAEERKARKEAEKNLSAIRKALQA